MEHPAIKETCTWLNNVVVGLDLCPFAAAPLASGMVGFTVSQAEDDLEILAELLGELDRIDDDLSATRLLIIPHFDKGFLAFCDLLAAAEDLLVAFERSSEYQLVSFHPDYLFAGTTPDDPGNYTNRSPHPMIHILRTQDVTAAVASHHDVAGIPQRNVAILTEMGVSNIRQRWFKSS